MSKKLTPRQYSDWKFDGQVTPKTVRRWLEKGLINGERSPTNRWFVLVSEDEQKNHSTLTKKQAQLYNLILKSEEE